MGVTGYSARRTNERKYALRARKFGRGEESPRVFNRLAAKQRFGKRDNNLVYHLSKWLVNAFKRRMDGEVDQGRSKLTRCSTFICVALRPQRKRNVDVARETGNLKS